MDAGWTRDRAAAGLMLFGTVLLIWWVFASIEAAGYRYRLAAALDEAVAARTGAAGVTLAIGAPVGRLEIPRLGLSEVVVEGDDEAILSRVVGHLPDTPLPWQGGNSALAAHRDTRFRALRRIRIGDLVRVATPYGTFTYRVTATHIVDPEDLWVLEPTAGRALTLITCHPFDYIGPAPRRFIVRAEEIAA